ncbi:MAG TPA: glycosyltransferase family 2 protein [Solirubrobacteraceae bacterium]|nr:glycosyltransferase family 2 protein [Solirubrobacteraceae bacterium]
MEKLPIAVQISTRNAAKELQACIDSVSSWCSEIVVVDMESEDDTCEIARANGATLVQVPAAGWAEPGRQAGVEAASQPWIFVLDVDERPGSELPQVAAELIASDDLAGVWIAEQNFQFGWWVPNSGIWPDYHMRLFRRDRTTYPGDRLHVMAQVSGRTEHAPARPECAILHHSFPTISSWVKTVDKYSDLEAKHMDEAGRSASVFRLFAIPFARFFEQYIVKRGYRGGRYGLTIALLSFVSFLLGELKLWERRLGLDTLPAGSIREPEA